MNRIQEAVRAYLEKESGVKAVSGRTRVRGEYPLLAVGVREDGTVLLAGGRQAEHTYRVTVTAAADRERDGNTSLLAGLPALLLRGVPAELNGERRVLHPLGISTEGEELSFSLALCVPVPPAETGGEAATETMQALHVEI